MSLNLLDMQQQVDVRVSKTSDGYGEQKKIFDKMNEEHKEIIVAELEYIKVINSSHPYPKREEKLKKLKTEIGDFVFSICCLANINKINLEESFKEAIEAETQQVISETQQTLSEFKSNRDYGDLLRLVFDLVNIYGIKLEECFGLMMEKNQNRAKNDYRKEKK